MSYKRRLRLIDSLTMMKHLSMTLKAGLNVSEALNTLDAKKGSTLKKIIDHLRISVESGHTFSEAMETAPRGFPPIVLQLIRIGEQSGALRENIEEASEYMTEIAETRREVKGAMLYPSLVFVAVIGLGLSIAMFVLPQIVPLFESMNVDLPFATRVLLKIAKAFEAHGWLIVAGTIVGFTGIIIIFRVNALKPITSRILLAIPLIGKIIHLFNLMHISRTLGSLLGSGIPIVESVQITARSVDNPVYRDILNDVSKQVADGNPLSEGLLKHKRIPTLFQRLINVGERTGSMQETFMYLSEFYASELRHSVKTLSTALEPLMLLIVGCMVGFVVFAIITPIYDITGSIK